MESEVLKDNIYLFTPKGDVIELPIGSTPIDFAYRVHSDIGDKMVGALVNNNIVPLDYELKDGDVVKIIVNKNSKGPSREWLNIVKTAQAKNKIKSYFSKIDKTDTIKRGEELLEKELRKLKISINEFFEDEKIDFILNELSLANIDELYNAIGSNKYTANYVINLITKETKSKEEIILDKLTKDSKKIITSKNDILVEGIDEIKVTLASCCTPIKGDKILGYITKGKGITVHRVECHNIAKLEERLIDVSWNENSDKKWPTNIVIETEKKDNFLLDLLPKASNANINIQTINTINNNNFILYDIIILVEDTTKLNKFINDVLQISSVHKVERIIR